MPKRVLFIEDDKALTKSLRQCIRQRLQRPSRMVRIKLVVARHKDEAMQLLRASKPSFDALIVDLMLPRNAKDLAELEKLSCQRRELVRRHYRRAGLQPAEPDEQMVFLQKQIDMLDSQIERRVDPEGGCEVLEQLARRCDPSPRAGRHPTPAKFPVVVFTARGLPKVKDRCKALVSEEYYRFFDKPAMETDVVEALLDLLVASQE